MSSKNPRTPSPLPSAHPEDSGNEAVEKSGSAAAMSGGARGADEPGFAAAPGHQAADAVKGEAGDLSFGQYPAQRLAGPHVRSLAQLMPKPVPDIVLSDAAHGAMDDRRGP